MCTYYTECYFNSDSGKSETKVTGKLYYRYQVFFVKAINLVVHMNHRNLDKSVKLSENIKQL